MIGAERKLNACRFLLFILMGHSAVIAVAANAQPYLFRIYDHTYSDYPAPFVRESEKAESAPIWDVAMATSALPYYFDYTTIRGRKYRDCGAGFNNPCLEAFAEVSDIHKESQNSSKPPIGHQNHSPRQHQSPEQSEHKAENDPDPTHAVSVFVSIGAGKRPMPALREGVKENMAWTAWSYTERAHEELERATRNTDTAYYRFNAGGSIGNMRVDEWNKETSGGKRVNRTLESIRRETNRYLEDPETKKCIQECAEKLVRFRRKQL